MPSDSSKPAWADANTLSVRKSTEKRVMGSGYYDPKDPPLRKETSTANVHGITWEHKDLQRAKESPDKVAQGDVIILSVMAEGIHAEARPGPGLDLVIINGSDRSPFLTRCKVDNRIQQNKVVVEWKVDCKVSQDGLKPGTDPVLWVSCEYNGFHGRSKADVLKIPVFVPPVCTIIEIPDTCFTAGSPIVPCLDDKGVFEGAFLALYGHVQKHPDTEAMVFGHSHSDAKADQTDRFDRSRYAAEMIRALLADDQERYVEIAGLCAEVADWQANLTGLSVHYDWNCNPTAVNNSFGPKTRQATRNFKEQCNQRYQMQLTVDEKLDDAAWKALFTVTRAIMSAAWKSASGKEVLPEITFIGQGVYPCSDSFAPNARQKGVRSKTGYRVEVGFFEKGTCPTLSPHEQKATKVEKTECPVYDDTRCKRSYLEYRNSESRVLRLRACEGPSALAHRQKGTYSVTAYSRTATESEKQSISWVVKTAERTLLRMDNCGDSFDFEALGKYVGEVVTVHPYLRSPSDSFCVKTTIGHCLVFDGEELVFLDKAHKEVKKWRAWSGVKGTTDPAVAGGPIPAGRWVVLRGNRQQVADDNWWQQIANKKTLEQFGRDRIEIVPFRTTEVHGRTGPFFIHGGKEPGTAHGIDLVDKMNEFLDEFEAAGDDLVLLVDYGTALVDESGYLLTSAQLESIYGSLYKSAIARFIKPLNDTMKKYEINTPLRIAHFIAQVGHESGRFRYTEEIASGAAYEGRVKSLGNSQPGDGKRFKGRGLIQITGRNNYTAYGAYLNRDFLTTERASEIAFDPVLSCDVAGWYWVFAEKPSGKKESLNSYADKDDVKRVTELINGGLNGFDDRKDLLIKAKGVLGIK